MAGVRFRPQGRDPAHGLDCIGLTAIACGVPIASVPHNYRLRSGDAARIARGLGAQGLIAVAPDETREGDVILAEAGPGQVHLAILTADGFVHADAAARRIVERPLPLPWPVLSAWRMSEGD